MLYCYLDMSVVVFCECFVVCYDVDLFEVIVGVGLVEIVVQFIYVVVGDGDEVIFVWWLFEVYLLFVCIVGVMFVFVFFDVYYVYDLDVMFVVIILCMWLIFVCNLNNLIGMVVDVDELECFVVVVLYDVLVVIDEVYVYFDCIESRGVGIELFC